MKNYETLFNGQCAPSCPTCGCESVNGNSIDVELHKGDCEVRADVVVAKTSGVRIWGQVTDCNGNPVASALVKLLKVTITCGQTSVVGVAHMATDCNGFYQFEVSPCEVGAKYKILVHKAAMGCERTVPSSALACSPCHTPNPCPQPSPCN